MRRKREWSRRTIWSNDDCKFTKINDRHQTADPGNSKNTKQDNTKYSILGTSYSKFRKPKLKKKSWRKPGRKKPKQCVTYRGKRMRIALTSWQTPCTQEENGVKYIVLKKKQTYKPRIVYLTKLSFKNKGETKTFLDK